MAHITAQNRRKACQQGKKEDYLENIGEGHRLLFYVFVQVEKMAGKSPGCKKEHQSAHEFHYRYNAKHGFGI